MRTFNLILNKHRYNVLILLSALILIACTMVYWNYYTDYFRVHRNLPFLDRSEYAITLRKKINDFESLSIIHVSNHVSLMGFINELESNNLAQKHRVESGTAPNLDWIRLDNKLSYLPFSLSCDCYTYSTYNLNSDDGVYLYQIFLYQDYLVIDYYTR